MIEFDTYMTDCEIKAHGFKELGLYALNDKELKYLIYGATVESKYDLIISTITSETYRVYKKVGE